MRLTDNTKGASCATCLVSQHKGSWFRRAAKLVLSSHLTLTFKKNGGCVYFTERARRVQHVVKKKNRTGLSNHLQTLVFGPFEAAEVTYCLSHERFQEVVDKVNPLGIRIQIIWPGSTNQPAKETRAALRPPPAPFPSLPWASSWHPPPPSYLAWLSLNRLRDADRSASASAAYTVVLRPLFSRALGFCSAAPPMAAAGLALAVKTGRILVSCGMAFSSTCFLRWGLGRWPIDKAVLEDLANEAPASCLTQPRAAALITKGRSHSRLGQRRVSATGAPSCCYRAPSGYGVRGAGGAAQKT
jgi:hypothetical protein